MIWVFAALTAVLVAWLLVLERADHPRRVWVKAAASTGFLAAAVAAGAFDSGYGRWVLAALGLSWVGDIALQMSGASWFRIGAAFFTVSQAAYVVAFAVFGIDVVPALVTAAALVMPATVVGVWLWTPAGREMRPVVVAYIVVISAMVAGAVGAVAAGAPGVIAVAAPLFYVSDLFVARNRFVAPGFVNRLAGLPLYYAAQILFAASTGLV